jgi:hypothetical protein
MKILYSYNKSGFEAEYWQREIAAAGAADLSFVPFNHQPFLPVVDYLRAQLLDNLYYRQDARLLRMYEALRRTLHETRADVLLVDNCHPYHPELLATLDIYKVLRTSDGPASAYDRDFAYAHAYDHVLYHSPAYSRDLTMEQKLRYVGAKRCDFWPLAVFDAFCRPEQAEDEVFGAPRDIDVLFVGALYPDKMPLLARVRKHLGRRFRIHGLSSFKRNAYFNLRYGFPGWVRPLPFEAYVPLYRRAKIGINAHLRGKYTVGNYRMFDLPANGVMQLSDGGEYLPRFYEPGREIEGYDDGDDLLAKIDAALADPRRREDVARAGYRRTMAEHRIGARLRALGPLLGDAQVRR